MLLEVDSGGRWQGGSEGERLGGAGRDKMCFQRTTDVLGKKVTRHNSYQTRRQPYALLACV